MTSYPDQVDALLSEWDRQDSPGCAVAVIQDGALAYSRACGMADLERGVPLALDSIFDIASTSKQFVAFCAALLARQGALDLDAAIQTYLPEMPRYADAISTRHLIQHTSGLRDYLGLLDLAGLPFENVYAVADILTLIARQQALNFRPGEAFLYSNSGYFLLGEIIRRTSGQSLRAFADRHIFQPLGMHSTHFHDDFREIVPRRALGYAATEEGGFRLDISLFDLVGDGALFTTVEDLARWDANFYDNRLGHGPDLIREITTPGRLNSGTTLNYAFGLFVQTYRGLPVISHGGSWMGYRAEMMRFPQQRCSVICLANLDRFNPSRLARRIADIYLAGVFPEALPPAVPAEAPAAELQELAGVYRSAQSGVVWELCLDAGELTAEVQGWRQRLAALGPDTFRALEAPYELHLTFERPDRLLVAAADELPDVLQKLPPLAPEQVRLDGYVGVYDSQEVGAVLTFHLEEGALLFSRRNTPSERLKPAAEDLFTAAELVFEFSRDGSGQVAAVDLSGSGLRGLRFTRQAA